METNLALKKWRTEARIPLIEEPFVDWFEAATEVEALAKWRAEAIACGFPVDGAVVRIKEAP